MKKTLAIFLSLLLLVSALTGCGNNNNTDTNSDTSNNQTENNYTDTSNNQTENNDTDTSNNQTQNNNTDTSNNQTENNDTDTSNNQTENNNTDTSNNQTENALNPAYKAIFDDTNIVHFQTFFNMETENFAMEDDEGNIYCSDYGYKDDVVKQWVVTTYTPVPELTDAQKTELETMLKTEFGSMDALNCCVVTYKMSTNYFTVTLTFSDVDKAENYGELYSAGIIDTNTLISMSEEETSMLSEGFVKKYTDTNSDTSNNQTENNDTDTSNNQTENAENPAYKAIFDDTNIVHFQTFFNMETKNFAMEDDTGIIYCSDFGYKDDVVKQWVVTIYTPVSEYTDAQKTELETMIKTEFGSMDALNCCVVTYKMSTNYFTVTFTYSDVDKAENYGELYSAGIIDTNTFFSMSEEETSLLSQGYVKK